MVYYQYNHRKNIIQISSKTGISKALSDNVASIKICSKNTKTGRFTVADNSNAAQKFVNSVYISLDLYIRAFSI